MALSTALAATVLPSVASFDGVERTHGLPPIVAIRSYVDPFFDFRMAVPEDWTTISLLAPQIEPNGIEDGYSIGFESQRSGENDRFADYIMVELLPGNTSAAFLTDGTEVQPIRIDGRSATRSRIVLDEYPVSGARIDLLVYQATVPGLSFQLGLYAIGEQREAAVLEQAFELLLHTFELGENPFPTF